MAHSDLPVPADELRSAVAHARDELRKSHEALAAVTGGAAPGQVLAELAQQLASDLAAYFDDLPMHRFNGRVRRGDGLLGRLMVARSIPHRVVAAGYLSSTTPRDAGAGYLKYSARIAVAALGSDGELRSGVVDERVQVHASKVLTLDLLAWDDPRIRRLPTRSATMRRWNGGPDPAQVARPNQMLSALTAIAAAVSATSGRDLALLQRFLR